MFLQNLIILQITRLVEKYCDFGTNVGMVEDCEAELEEEEEWNGRTDHSTFSDEGDTNKFESNDENVRKCKLLNIHLRLVTMTEKRWPNWTL